MNLLYLLLEQNIKAKPKIHIYNATYFVAMIPKIFTLHKIVPSNELV